MAQRYHDWSSKHFHKLMATRKKMHPAGTKRTMRISGGVLIASWLLIAYTVEKLSVDGSSFQMGQLGALGLAGIALIITSFFIKEKKKKEHRNT